MDNNNPSVTCYILYSVSSIACYIIFISQMGAKLKQAELCVSGIDIHNMASLTSLKGILSFKILSK